MRRRDPDKRVRKLQEQRARAKSQTERTLIDMELEWIAESRAEAKQADREAGIW